MIETLDAKVYKTSNGQIFLEQKQALIVERGLMIHAFIDKIGLTGGNWRCEDIGNAISDNADELLRILIETKVDSDITLGSRILNALVAYVEPIVHDLTKTDAIPWHRRNEVLQAILNEVYPS